jgi:hypothetical protein
MTTKKAKKTESIKKTEKMKTTHQKTLSVDSFLKLKPFYKNRDVMVRVKKKKKELQNGFLPSHLNVVIGVAKKSFYVYKEGDTFVLDGNTRAEVWRQNPDLKPSVPLNAVFMEFEDKELLEKTYYSIDSATAYEKVNEKLSGIFREIGFQPVSKIVQRGTIKTALDDVSAYIPIINGRVKKESTIEDVVKHYRDELEYVDSFIDEVNKKKYSSNLFACLLMIGKKYGVNDKKYNELCHNIIFNIYGHSKETQICPIQYVMDELYTANIDIWKVTGVRKSPDLVAEMLYVLEYFMQNKMMKKKDNYKNTRVKKHLDHYMNYFNN